MKTPRTSFFAAAVLLAGTAWGQPVITGVTGSWEEGQPVSIEGSGFGEKAQAAPLKWDDFEGGTPGEQAGNGWFTDHREGDYPLYADDVVRDGSAVSVVQDYVTPGNYNCSFGLNTAEQTHFFVSFYRYADAGGTGPGTSRNYKIMSLRGGGAGAWDPPEFRHDMYSVSESGHSYFADCEGTVFGQDWGNGYELTSGVWERFDYDVELRGADGQATYKRWKDGELRSQVSEASTATGCGYTNIYINGYWAQSTFDESGTEAPCPDGCPATFWIDDVYVDTSRARVDLCDAATWSGREAAGARCELQIPTAWSDGAITASANLGAFPCGADVFLFVVDEDGAVNESGYPVTLGTCGETDEAAPEAPADAPPDAAGDGPGEEGGGGCGCVIAR